MGLQVLYTYVSSILKDTCCAAWSEWSSAAIHCDVHPSGVSVWLAREGGRACLRACLRPGEHGGRYLSTKRIAHVLTPCCLVSPCVSSVSVRVCFRVFS